MNNSHVTLERPRPNARIASTTGPDVTARPGRFGPVRASVAAVVFVLLLAGAVAYGADLRVDLALAVAWTALFVLVWELGARVLSLLGRRPAR